MFNREILINSKLNMSKYCPGKVLDFLARLHKVQRAVVVLSVVPFPVTLAV